MWKQNQPVAVVNAINGRRQYFVTLTGVPNHAGSTQMADRNDALVGAAECCVALEQLAHELNRQLPHTVITVGRLDCRAERDQCHSRPRPFQHRLSRSDRCDARHG